MTPMTPQLERAVVFAAMTNRGGVQAWMLWPGWVQYVGCHRCSGDGPAAVCWGVEGCHGYAEACGCAECAEIEAEELRAENARSLQALAAGLGEDVQLGRQP